MNEEENSQPLTLDDIAERVQRILDDPTREADELDPVVLQVLQERRASDIEAAPAADRDELLEPTASDDEQQDRTASADPVSQVIEQAASSREQTDGDQVEYSRWTGQPISGPSAGRSPVGGGGRSHSR
jgi:hypothetical protein